jgi:hypothetical protein
MLRQGHGSALESMSFHFYLYRAGEGLPPINSWAELLAEPLGSLEQIRNELSELFPQIQWELGSHAWHGFGAGYPAQGPYLDILLSEDAPGQCHFVVLNKAPPSVMRKIMEHMRLNYVCALEAGDLVDPYAYGDDDPYYAKRAAGSRES